MRSNLYNGSKFQCNTVNRILHNRMYCGYLVQGKVASPKIKKLAIVIDGEKVVYGYDVKNNLTEVQYDDKIISYEYDKFNNRTKKSDESGTYVYTYDNGNRLTKVTKNSVVEEGIGI